MKTGITISFVLLSILLMNSCSGKRKVVAFMETKSIKPNQENTLAGKLFFIGPKIDSVNAEIIAECDCCASDLAFVNDSLFIYVERCLGGDGYSKGNYKIFGNTLLLRFDRQGVQSTEDYNDLGTITYTVHQSEKESVYAYSLSQLKSKQVICFTSGDYKEYGMVNTTIDLSDHLTELKEDKVWNKLGLR